MGIALGQQPYTDRDLAAGTLVELFPGKRVRNPRSWHLACRKEKQQTMRVEVFREWLLQQVAEDESLPRDQASG